MNGWPSSRRQRLPISSESRRPGSRRSRGSIWLMRRGNMIRRTSPLPFPCGLSALCRHRRASRWPCGQRASAKCRRRLRMRPSSPRRTSPARRSATVSWSTPSKPATCRLPRCACCCLVAGQACRAKRPGLPALPPALPRKAPRRAAGRKSPRVLKVSARCLALLPIATGPALRFLHPAPILPLLPKSWSM